jgi:hypothetical protein
VRATFKAVMITILSLLTLLAAQQREPRAKVQSPHGNLNQPCESCHTYSAWKPIRSRPEFNHNQTKYPLRGMHEGVSCRECHTSLVFANVGTKCADCHADFHRRQMGANCEQCHTVKGWRVSLQAISQHQNRFPLIGAHAALDCESCHTGAASGQYIGLSTQCLSCHRKDFQTPVLDHVAMGFPTDCTVCHTMNTWLGAKFDHNKFTNFPLTGIHATLDCQSCHANGRFKGTPATCYACHAKDYNGTTNPNHVQAGFPQDCATCHSTSSWMGANFDHSMTKFPLTGLHTTVQCAQCHVNNNYTSLPTDCASCHLNDYNGTTNPNHKSSGLPTTCEVCHTTAGWQPAKFDHSLTKFPLTGMHTSVQCAQCHINNNYTTLPTDCASCHINDYNGTTNPNHKTTGFPTTCEVCHTTAGWQPAAFDHSTTKFPLTGLHTTVQCAQCHVNNNYTTLPTDCASCHINDYNGTTNPNHKASGFPTDCSICHTTMGWQMATFNHATTGFALTGFHASLACSSCHVNGNYNLTASTCVTCHQTDYNNTTNPNHISAGFPTTCDVCHTTTAWTPASFDHSKTPFPLTGAHTTVACTKCHINNVFAGTPTDCYSCHTADYNGVTNPNHISAHFPTTCATCHTTSTWLGAVFNHTWFPIYSGTHAGKWVTCADCHINSADFSAFSCITCHQHAQAQTDPHHQGVRNYVYGPTTCYTCHPSGNGG